MKKAANVMVPVFFIIMGIVCLTMSSTAFHSQNPLHHFFESFLGICIFMVVPIFLVVFYIGFNRRKNKTRKKK
ncbi:hypothetical protein BTO28_02540 [Domibacillus epiphyticus]|uniref:Uncharacterized protein n=1 Tax=Domibacillus epiphyticus TaxID=1714355 RepID=A0A1V2ABE6_9BACI|nr:hypothetical protein BTO28_02540 [Domibacillus epiphyticus]